MPRSIPARPKTERQLIGAALGLLGLVALLAAGAVSYALANRWVRHTLEVRQAADDWMIALLEVKTEARDFVLHRESASSESYEAARRRERQKANVVAALLADNPVQKRYVAAAERHAQTLLHTLNELVAASKAGEHERARSIMSATPNDLHIGPYRQQVRAMRAEEDRLLVVRRARADALAKLTVLGGVLLPLASSLLLGFAWRRERAHDALVKKLAVDARQRLAALSEVAGALAQARSSSQVAEVIVNLGMRVADANTCTLYTLDESGKTLSLLIERGIADAVLEHVRQFNAENNPHAFASMYDNRAVWVEDEVHYASLFPALAQVKAEGPRAKAFWSVPLYGEGQALGLLAMGFYEARSFSADDRAFVDTFCKQCAQALLRAQRLEREEHERAQRELLAKAMLREAEQARAQERLLRGEAEIASRAKDEFLATVSHELRTPLNAILGWTVLLREKKPEPEIERGLNVIERNARAQAKLIEDVLDVSRIISGKLTLNTTETDVADAIASAVESVTPAAQVKGIELSFQQDPSVPRIVADPDRLQQIVWNLLSNAVKFTPQGGRVSVRSERLGADVSIRISDSGEGIRPDALPYIFEPFQQADASTTRRHGGLGLGLAIVKQLVTAHGGSVHAESAGIGHGATFVVQLPTRAAITAVSRSSRPSPASEPAQRGIAGAPRLDGLRLLAVDDESDSRAMVMEVLRACGAQVAQAASASEALSMFQRERPDVIISDIGMPGEDGYSLIRKIRALPVERGGRTPAVALTAYARSEDAQRAFSAGFQIHLAKPVEPVQLATVVANLGGRSLNEA
jgi:signal transduction histidine kinase/CHASE3 domain sensor protein